MPLFTDEQPAPLRALILGDSLGAPRPHRGQKLDETWPVLLKKRFPQIDIWQRCRAGSMSDEVRKEYNLFSDSIDGFNLLVIQVGIGDCCPRPYPLFLEKFMLTFGFRRFQKRLNSWYPFLLKFRSRTWISQEEFVSNIRYMIDTTKARNAAMDILVVKIGTPCAEFVKKVKNAAAGAERYNQALERLCTSFGESARVTLIDPYRGFLPEMLFISDGHHLTVPGHRAVAEALERHFARLASAMDSPKIEVGGRRRVVAGLDAGRASEPRSQTGVDRVLPPRNASDTLSAVVR